MAFGDWELFRMVIASLRELELSSFSTHEEGPRSVRFTVGSEQIQRKGIHNVLHKQRYKNGTYALLPYCRSRFANYHDTRSDARREREGSIKNRRSVQAGSA